MRTTWMLGLTLLVGCASPGDDDDSAEPPPQDACAASLAQGDVRVVATGFVGGTEGVTFSPDGRLFVSSGDTVEEVFSDGRHEVIADVPATVGLAWWGDELIVASGDSGEGLDTGGVYAVDVDSGDVRLLAGGIPGANFPAVTPWETLLVSTPSGPEEIVEVSDDGDVSLWSAEVPSPNGIGFVADGSGAFVASTFGSARLSFVPVEEGAAGTPEQTASWGPATAPDGLAIGASDAVYLTQNIAGRIDRIQRDGTVEEVATAVDFAASAAFGVGADWDPCAVYVTSLAGSNLYAVGVGEPAGTLWR